MYMIKLRIRSLSKESLSLFKNLVAKTLESTNISYTTFDLPAIKKRVTLLKSPHVNKTAREQFQLTSHRSLITLKIPLNLEIIKFLIVNKPKTVKIVLFKF